MTLSDPYYMSPENVALYRAKDSYKPRKQEDIFALGVLLLEMCNLERKGEDPLEG